MAGTSLARVHQVQRWPPHRSSPWPRAGDQEDRQVGAGRPCEPPRHFRRPDSPGRFRLRSSERKPGRNRQQAPGVKNRSVSSPSALIPPPGGPDNGPLSLTPTISFDAARATPRCVPAAVSAPATRRCIAAPGEDVRSCRISDVSASTMRPSRGRMLPRGGPRPSDLESPGLPSHAGSAEGQPRGYEHRRHDAV